MKLTQRIVQWFSVIALAATSSAALAAPLPQDPINLDQLLQQLEQGKFSQSESNKQREQRFREKEQEQIVIDNRKLLAWFQEDMACVEIDWDGVHVVHLKIHVYLP